MTPSRDDMLIAPLLDSDSRAGAKISMRKDRRSSFMNGLASLVAGVAIVILIWYVVAWLYNEVFHLSLIPFSTPGETFNHLWVLMNGGNMFGVTLVDHLTVSLGRWVTGYVIAVVIGITLGLLLGYSSRLYSVGMVPVYVLQMIPGLAWIPVAMLLFGLGDQSAVFIISMTAIAPIVVNVSAGIRKVPPVTVRVARMVGSSNLSLFFKVLIPYAVLDINNGLRIGLANAWRVLIAAEMVVGVAMGLGFSISQATYTIDYVTAFACIIVICAIGLFVEKVVFAAVERYARSRLGLEGGL